LFMKSHNKFGQFLEMNKAALSTCNEVGYMVIA